MTRPAAAGPTMATARSAGARAAIGCGLPACAARRRVAFVSSSRGWGGSEELWAATAERLAADGHRVSVYKSGLSRAYPQVVQLERVGCRIHDLDFAGPTPRRFPLIAALAS